MRSAAKMKCSDRKEVEMGRWCREREKVEDLFCQAKSDELGMIRANYIDTNQSRGET